VGKASEILSNLTPSLCQMKNQGHGLCLLGVLLLAVAGGSCSRGMPAPKIRHEGDGTVVVDVSTLGEYQTTVTRFQLIDLSESRIVWEFTASSGKPQIWEVRLVPGENSVAPPEAEYGQYTTRSPENQQSFFLSLERGYAVQIWGDEQDPARCIFQLADSTGSEPDRPH